MSSDSFDQQAAGQPNPVPPVAKKVPTVVEIQGHRLRDDYAWLRIDDIESLSLNPDVEAYLKAENAYTAAMTSHLAPLQEKLFQEYSQSPDEFLSEAPVPDGDYDYSERRDQGKQYKVFVRRQRTAGAQEEVLLDLNRLAEGHQFCELGAMEIGRAGTLLAYSTDTNGFRQYELHIKDLATGETVSGIAQRVTSLAWAKDGSVLFYTTEDEKTKRSNKLFRYQCKDASSTFLYEEKDELFEVSVSGSRSGEFIFVASTSYESTEYRFIKAARPYDRLRLIRAREHGHSYHVEHHGHSFFIRTNENARNYRLVKAPVSRPGKKNWKEVIAHNADTLVEATVAFSNHLLVFERTDGLEKLRVIDMRSKETHYIEFPEAVYNVGNLEDVEMFERFNRQFETEIVRFRYDSFRTPPEIYDYNMSTRQRVLVEKVVIPGFNPDDYHVERIEATANDGVSIPIVLVWKGDLKKDGNRKMHLYGYGAYGLCALWAGHFRVNRLSLLNRGVVFACAYIRGGGERGEIWHDQGKMLLKRNTFTDFIQAADHLVAQGYSSHERMVIEGRSAGGLLMGAVVNMRPDICKAALVGVPFVDVMNTMSDTSLPLTAGEFEEWGDPRKSEFFHYMLSYSPYDNIEAKDYPTILVQTALRDSAVMFWEPAKYTAKLRAFKTDKNPLLFRILLTAGGHAGLSARSDALREDAFRFAFILDQLGISE